MNIINRKHKGLILYFIQWVTYIINLQLTLCICMWKVYEIWFLLTFNLISNQIRSNIHCNVFTFQQWINYQVWKIIKKMLKHREMMNITFIIIRTLNIQFGIISMRRKWISTMSPLENMFHMIEFIMCIDIGTHIKYTYKTWQRCF